MKSFKVHKAGQIVAFAGPTERLRLQRMPASLLHIPLALAQAAATAIALPSATTELPGGSSAVFREKMMDWSAPDEAPAAVVAHTRRGHSTTEVRLPSLSSHFGVRSDPLRGTPRMHSGIDIPGPLGTPVQASADGIVHFAGNAGGYGKMVEIAHGNGLSTRYAHLSRILVQPGSAVMRGETIALMGSTGRSTGSHLHFEVRQNGRAANPLSYFGGDMAAAAPFTAWQTRSEPHISRFARARAAERPSPAEPF